MGFGEAIRHGFANYATFRGVAARSEYWWWQLFTSLISLPYLGFVLAGAVTPALVAAIPVLALAVPSYAVTARRLRDGGFSWKLMFLYLAPGGSIAVLVLCVMPSVAAPGAAAVAAPGAVAAIPAPEPRSSLAAPGVVGAPLTPPPPVVLPAVSASTETALPEPDPMPVPVPVPVLTAAPVGDHRFCHVCGAAAEGKAFCSYCGAQLIASAT